MSDLIVTVRGTSESRIAPERATVRVAAETDGGDRAAVIADVHRAVEPLRASLADLQARGAVETWSNPRVSIWAERPWNDAGAQLEPVHHASLVLTAVFADLEAVSGWLDDVSAEPSVRIDGIDWHLTPTTARRLERETAAAAVSDAVERATAYAGAIGRTKLEPLDVADAGLLSATPEPVAERAALKSVMMDAAGSPGFAVTPADVVVTAAVDARFRAS